MEAVTKVVAFDEAAKAAVVAKLELIEEDAHDTDTGTGAFTALTAQLEVI